MRVLVTWGSKRGGTEGIGRIVAAELESRGFEVVAAPTKRAPRPDAFDAVVVGGALYSNRWIASARRFVNRHVRRLRKLPVWLYSSGPLSDAAERGDIAATGQVAVLAERIGAQGHVTFGGRLTPDARGFPASAMAKKKSGDWRNPDRIRAWTRELAGALPTATAGQAVQHPAHSVSRLVAYAVAGWALCGVVMGILLSLVGVTVALVLHALAAPAIFFMLAKRYFRARGARDPLPTAVSWTIVVMLLDLIVVAGMVQHSLAMFRSIAGTWVPFSLILISTWITGEVMAMLPERPVARVAE